MAGATWLALNVVSGGGGFSGSQPIGVTKIAKSVIAPLADQNISVFMLSTYQTDFILVSRGLARRGRGWGGPQWSPAPSCDPLTETSGVPGGHRSGVSTTQVGLRGPARPHTPPAFRKPCLL